MSDLFTSLAAQALGVAPSIRPLATPMFAPSPPMANELPVDLMGETAWANLSPVAAADSTNIPTISFATGTGVSHTWSSDQPQTIEYSQSDDRMHGALPETTGANPVNPAVAGSPPSPVSMPGSSPTVMSTPPADAIDPLNTQTTPPNPPIRQSSPVKARTPPENPDAAIASLDPSSSQSAVDPRSSLPSFPVIPEPPAPPTAAPPKSDHPHSAPTAHQAWSISAPSESAMERVTSSGEAALSGEQMPNESAVTAPISPESESRYSATADLKATNTTHPTPPSLPSDSANAVIQRQVDSATMPRSQVVQPSAAPSPASPPSSLSSVAAQSPSHTMTDRDHQFSDMPQSHRSSVDLTQRAATTSSPLRVAIVPPTNHLPSDSLPQRPGSIQTPVVVAQRAEQFPANTAPNVPANSLHATGFDDPLQRPNQPPPMSHGANSLIVDRTADQPSPVSHSTAAMPLSPSPSVLPLTGAERSSRVAVDGDERSILTPPSAPSNLENDAIVRSRSVLHAAQPNSQLASNQGRDMQNTNLTDRINRAVNQSAIDHFTTSTSTIAAVNQSVIDDFTANTSTIASGNAQVPLQPQQSFSASLPTQQNNDRHHRSLLEAEQDLQGLQTEQITARAAVNPFQSSSGQSLSAQSSFVRPSFVQPLSDQAALIPNRSAPVPVTHSARTAAIQAALSPVGDEMPLPQIEPSLRATTVSQEGPQTAATAVPEANPSSPPAMRDRRSQPDSQMQEARRLQWLTRDRPPAQPPAIRVSIGRIRIAAPPPPPTATQFSRPRPSLSLDQYLSRRQERQ